MGETKQKVCENEKENMMAIDMDEDILENSNQSMRFEHCFRGDMKWVGADICMDDKNEYEYIIALTENSTVYTLYKPHSIKP